MQNLKIDDGQLATLKEMLARTTRGIEQTRANIKRMMERKYEPGSKIDLRRIEGVARLTDIVHFQERVIATLTPMLEGK